MTTKCDRCDEELEPILAYRHPPETQEIHVFVCTQCMSYLQEYIDGGEHQYSVWGEF